MARLEFSTLRQPRAGIVLMLCLGLCLLVLSLSYLLQGATPRIIPIIMLLASLTLVIGFSLALYRIKPLHRIRVVMLDGTAVTLSRKKKAVALELLDGLTDAMDWHRSGNIEIDAQRASHLRQEVAQGRAQMPSKPSSSTPSSTHSSTNSSRPSSRSRDSRRSTASQAILRGFSRLRGKRADTFEPTRTTTSTQGKARAQGQQKPLTAAGPVLVMKEVTLSGRVKILFTRLTSWLLG